MSIALDYFKRTLRRRMIPSSRHARYCTPIGSFVMPIDWKNSSLVNCLYIHNKVYEPETVAYIEEHVKSDDVVLDVGANFGYYSVLFSELARDGVVHAFEPNPKCYDVLLRNTLLRKNVVLHKKAVSDSIGRTWFFNHRGYGAGGLMPREHMRSRFHVDTVTIDSFDFGRVDWVKIDVEGYEGEVLEGMRDTIDRNPQIRLIVEFKPERGLNDSFWSVLEDFHFKGLDHNVLAFREEAER